MNEYHPDYRVHPYETLREVMRENGLTAEDVATRGNLGLELVRHLVNGRAPMTPLTARGLERATGIKARTWVRLQENFDMLDCIQENDCNEQ